MSGSGEEDDFPEREINSRRRSNYLGLCGRGISRERRSLSIMLDIDLHQGSVNVITTGLVSRRRKLKNDVKVLWIEFVLWVGCDENGNLPLCFSSKVTMTIISDQSQVGDILQDNLTTAPPNHRGHQKQGKSEKLSQPRGP